MNVRHFFENVIMKLLISIIIKYNYKMDNLIEIYWSAAKIRVSLLDAFFCRLLKTNECNLTLRTI
jgi:hypothetical protein